MKKLGIVGFGASAIGFIHGLIESGKISNYRITILERGKDYAHNTISGVRMDGKIFISYGMGGEIYIPLEIQAKTVEFYLKFSGYKPAADRREGLINYLRSFERDGKKIEFGESFSNERVYKLFYHHGFEPVKSYFFHLGTDILKETNENIYRHFSSFENIEFLFGVTAEDVDFGPPHRVHTEKGDFEFDELVIAVGRSGHRLMERLKEKYPQLVKPNQFVDIGIRYELPNHVMDPFSDMYEVKIRYRTKTGYICRIFCQNPAEGDPGKVRGLHHGERILGQSSKDREHELCHPGHHAFYRAFKDPTGYGVNLAKLANILAGDREKVILQTYGDFKEFRRTKRLGRVHPTLDPESYILGDANLVFPSKIRESLVDFVENLDRVIPGAAYFDNLLYAVEVKFYTNKFLNDVVEDLHVIGDCSGWTRSVQYATSMGYMRAMGMKIQPCERESQRIPTL
nr:NAD(P)/FAD-dependent oxidoreductase [Thermotoga neapolitana]